MKEFKSKISYGILIPVLLLLIVISLLPIIAGATKLAIITTVLVTVPVILLTLHMFFSTTYRINDHEELEIKTGFFYDLTVQISTIKSIKKTSNPIASPAASMDRIELRYGKWDAVIISPINKTEFINELLTINPNIQLNGEFKTKKHQV